MSANVKKILITGGSGDLGKVLAARAVVAGFDVTATYLNRPERIKAGKPYKLDLLDKQAVEVALDTLLPDVVIHTAVPATSATMRQEIVSAAYHLSNLVSRTSRLIFLSTDMVFDGTQSPYRDDDAPSPMTPYGQAKAEMEMMADHVVRTSLIYDFAPGNKQVDWIVEKIRRSEPVRLFSNEYRSPIWSVNLADAILELMDGKIKGVLNVAGPQSMSRVELGSNLLRILGYNPADHVEEALAGADRQPNLTLDVSKAKMLLKTPLLTFDQAFAIWQASQPWQTDSISV